VRRNTTKIGVFVLSDHHNGHLRAGRFKFWRSNGR